MFNRFRAFDISLTIRCGARVMKVAVEDRFAYHHCAIFFSGLEVRACQASAAT